MLMSDSETESDDDINNFVVVVGPRKRNTENLRLMEKREGKRLLSPSQKISEHLKSKAHEQNKYIHFNYHIFF